MTDNVIDNDKDDNIIDDDMGDDMGDVVDELDPDEDMDEACDVLSAFLGAGKGEELVSAGRHQPTEMTEVLVRAMTLTPHPGEGVSAGLVVDTTSVDTTSIDTLPIDILPIDTLSIDTLPPPDFPDVVDTDSPTTLNTSRMSLTRARAHDRRTEDIEMHVFKLASLLGYAKHRAVARKVWDTETWQKPAWAVRGLVLLRDGGLCRMCGGRTGKDVEVRGLIPPSCGGVFCEPMCVTVCGQCVICWEKYKNFFQEGDMLYGFKKLQRLVLRRRANGYHGCKTLTHEQAHELSRCSEQVRVLGQVHRVVKTSVGAKALEKFLTGGGQDEG